MRFLNTVLALVVLSSCAAPISAQRSDGVLEDRSVNLAKPRTPGAMQYRFSTDYLTYAPDGSLAVKEQTIADVEIGLDETGRQTLTARRFELVDGDGVRATIPELEGWQNVMNADAAEVLGVPQADFAGLLTDAGESLPPEIAHRVYNTFVDFYAFNNVFAEPSSAEGKDIGDLTSIGQIIEHYSAYSRPLIGGESSGEESYFQNGRVTLEWKGMSRVGENACALVGFDSGESDFRMALEPAPGVDLNVRGGSHYWGDLHINTESLWLEKATFIEIVVARTIYGDNPPFDAVIKRIGQIVTLN